MYEFDCDKVKFNITKNKVIGCNGSKALVTMDLYNSLKANIHKDVVASGGTLMLAIDA